MADLYLDLSSGVSGDMFTAALLDLGADEAKLRAVLDSLGLPGFAVKVSRVTKASLNMCDFKVELTDDNHDADMSYLFAHRKPLGISALRPSAHDPQDPCGLVAPVHAHEQHHHDHEHHEHDHEHAHEHHEHAHEHHHAHVHRGLKDILPLIDKSAASARAKDLAVKIFTLLAEAEAKAHGVSVNEVHFHEVGALDSIVDILSAAVCVDLLNIDKVYATPLCEGQGQVRCAHGLLPIPVPAVSNILEKAQLPLTRCDVYGELVTPTGAAIIAALQPSFAPPPASLVLKSGYGAGKRAYTRPSFVRAQLLQPLSAATVSSAAQPDPTSAAALGNDEIIKLECNIDDMSGELFGALMAKLQAKGARDVSYLPLFMKKNRPAYLLQVICDAAALPDIARTVLTESTAIGLRWCPMRRLIMDRSAETFTSSLGEVKVKRCVMPAVLGAETFCYPEYESLKELAAACKLPLKTVDALVRGELAAAALKAEAKGDPHA